MKTAIVWLLLLPVLSMPALAKPPTAAQGASQLAAMKKLNFLMGQWKGQGWAAVSGSKATFTDTELVTSKSNGLELTIQSSGITDAGAPARQGSVVVSYDAATKAYHLHNHQADGTVTDTPAQVTSNSLVWIVRDPHHGPIRFIIQVNAKGQWVESGELSNDGKTWQKFMSLTLARST